MKTTHIFGLISLFFFMLVIAFALRSFDQQQVVFAQNTGAVSAIQDVTPTPIAADQSEIGSTDGILVMGIVIVVIVITPLLFRKKRDHKKSR